MASSLSEVSPYGEQSVWRLYASFGKRATAESVTITIMMTLSQDSDVVRRREILGTAVDLAPWVGGPQGRTTTERLKTVCD